MGDTPIPKDSKADGGVIWNFALDMANKSGDYEWMSRLADSPLGAEVSQAASKLSLSRLGKSEEGAQATLDRIKEAKDSVKASNPKGQEEADNLVKETQDSIKEESDKKSLEDILDENAC